MEPQGIKERLKKEIAKKFDKVPINYSDDRIKQDIESFFNNIVRRDREASGLSPLEQKDILEQIVNEITGLGPIEELMRDPSISEIMIDRPKQICVERNGKIELTDVTFQNEDHLLYFVDKILSPLGRRLSQLEPYVDARLKDGSRVNVIRSPLSLTGTVMTIRKFNKNVFQIKDLVDFGTLTADAAGFLKASVAAKLNILISGGTSSGKTTTLNTLLSFIGPDERIITIEDTVELQLSHRFLIRLETRIATVEGKGEVTIRDLLKNSLHMRPDRIIVGEVRGEEVIDMLQAMNVGHEGSMTTIHANSPEDCLNRLEIMALIGQPNFTAELIRREIISAIDLIVQQKRFPDGKRKIVKISELKAKKKEEYELTDIFVFDQACGQLVPTGAVPENYPVLKERAEFFYQPWEG